MRQNWLYYITQTMTILVTWSSWFIWFHTAKKLLEQGFSVVWFDNENDYYDPNLKLSRRTILESYPKFNFYKADLKDKDDLQRVFEEHTIEKIIHLAAQAGVRYCLENPSAYLDSNLIWFFNIIEIAKEYNVEKFIYASSSSIYGNSEKPSSIEDKTDSPLSFYAATKKANELIAHSYSHTFNLSTIGLRFFTVYWPQGRPDMAIPIFVKKILQGESIDLYNYGEMRRDFTYIDDIVEGIIAALAYETQFWIFNLWWDMTYELEHVIELIEQHTNKKAIKNYLPIQPGEVKETSADISHTIKHFSWTPKTSLEDGIKAYIDRHQDFYNK